MYFSGEPRNGLYPHWAQHGPMSMLWKTIGLWERQHPQGTFGFDNMPIESHLRSIKCQMCHRFKALVWDFQFLFSSHLCCVEGASVFAFMVFINTFGLVAVITQGWSNYVFMFVYLPFTFIRCSFSLLFTLPSVFSDLVCWVVHFLILKLIPDFDCLTTISLVCFGGLIIRPLASSPVCSIERLCCGLTSLLLNPEPARFYLVSIDFSCQIFLMKDEQNLFGPLEETRVVVAATPKAHQHSSRDLLYECRITLSVG